MTFFAKKTSLCRKSVVKQKAKPILSSKVTFRLNKESSFEKNVFASRTYKKERVLQLYKKDEKSGSVASRFASHLALAARRNIMLGVCCVGGAFGCVCVCVFDVVCFGYNRLWARSPW